MKNLTKSVTDTMKSLIRVLARSVSKQASNAHSLRGRRFLSERAIVGILHPHFYSLHHTRSYSTKPVQHFSSSVSPKREYFFNQAMIMLDKDALLTEQSDADVDSSTAICEGALDLIEQAIVCGPEYQYFSEDENLSELSYMYYRKGLLLYQMAQYADAVSAFDAATGVERQREHPVEYADRLHYKALALSWLGQLEESIVLLNRALELDPTNSSIWTDKGRIHLDLQQNDLALTCYDKVLELDPSNAQPLKEKARALAIHGNFGIAISYYEKYISIAPTDAGALAELANALFEKSKEENLERSLSLLENAMRIAPKDPSIPMNKASLLMLAGRETEAIACYDLVYKLDSNSTDALIQKANALYRLQRLEEALACCELALSKGIDIESSGAALFKRRIQERLMGSTI